MGSVILMSGYRDEEVLSDMNESDEVLVPKAVAGDADAISQLLQRHGPAVERALRIDRSWQGVLDAADVMQVTYLETFMRIKSFDVNANASFSTWLRHVAENNLKDAIRGLSRKKRPQPKDRVVPTNYEDSVVGLCDVLGMTVTTPSRHAGRKEICQVLEQAIAGLPDDYAQVIRRYDMEGAAIGDVAKAMGRSTGAVHMLRARAHDRLRETLGTASMFLGSHGA